MSWRPILKMKVPFIFLDSYINKGNNIGHGKLKNLLDYCSKEKIGFLVSEQIMNLNFCCSWGHIIDEFRKRIDVVSHGLTLNGLPRVNLIP
jgi:hypothetical protein